jgi:hypothetical protein
MNALAIAASVVLTAVAAVHVFWGFGFRWPAHDERGLVATVVGATGRTRMPGLSACVAAATAIFIAGLVPLALANILPVAAPPVLITAIGVFTALVFGIRGWAAYSPSWRRRFSQEPFANLDRNWYGPLCLVLAAIMLLLVIKRVLVL